MLLFFLYMVTSLVAVGSDTTVEFGCASRLFDGQPFAKNGSPVQFIHARKGGGKSIQEWLENDVAPKLQLKYIEENMMEGRMSPTLVEIGSLLAGHQHLGWGKYAKLKELNAFYMAVIGDPIEMMKSLFYFEEFMLDHLDSLPTELERENAKEKGMYARKKIKEACEMGGVAPGDVFWYLVINDKEFQPGKLHGKLINFAFFVPQHIYKLLYAQQRNSHSIQASVIKCAVHFALNWIDAITDVDTLSGLWVQLLYHAPKTISYNMIHQLVLRTKVSNETKGNETLANMAKDVLMRSSELKQVYDGYNVLRAIGLSRTRRADAILGTFQFNITEPCSVHFGPKEDYSWIFYDIPDICTMELKPGAFEPLIKHSPVSKTEKKNMPSHVSPPPPDKTSPGPRAPHLTSAEHDRIVARLEQYRAALLNSKNSSRHVIKSGVKIID